MKRKGLSLTEIVIAVSILSMGVSAIMYVYSSSGKLLQKTQNFTFASNLASSIYNKLQALPFKSITDKQVVPIAGGPQDFFFRPFINYQDAPAGVKNINKIDLPDLFTYIKKYNFKYSLSVVSVAFAPGDEVKSVEIQITWNEGGDDLMYRLQTYINCYE